MVLDKMLKISNFGHNGHNHFKKNQFDVKAKFFLIVFFQPYGNLKICKCEVI